MTRQEHGRNGFIALLLAAATEQFALTFTKESKQSFFEKKDQKTFACSLLKVPGAY